MLPAQVRIVRIVDGFSLFELPSGVVTLSRVILYPWHRLAPAALPAADVNATHWRAAPGALGHPVACAYPAPSLAFCGRALPGFRR